ncbi:hypothetical protein V6N13_074553 [Hibiscus sabdariffa]|uniref:Uncharacterized protein n=1 Tax=Hibiscus sabdariffa TaxID=183260 RepID=A0ABR2U923_9ROSI
MMSLTKTRHSTIVLDEKIDPNIPIMHLVAPSDPGDMRHSPLFDPLEKSQRCGILAEDIQHVMQLHTRNIDDLVDGSSHDLRGVIMTLDRYFPIPNYSL